MSRTYKDRPEKIRFPEAYSWEYGTEKVSYQAEVNVLGTDDTVLRTRFWYKEVPGAKTKKRKETDTDWHWMSTPSWWTRMTMNRPQRRAAHLWEKEAVRTPVEELEELDTPNTSHKPHIYYY